MNEKHRFALFFHRFAGLEAFLSLLQIRLHWLKLLERFVHWLGKWSPENCSFKWQNYQKMETQLPALGEIPIKCGNRWTANVSKVGGVSVKGLTAECRTRVDTRILQKQQPFPSSSLSFIMINFFIFRTSRFIKHSFPSFFFFS